MTPGIQKRFIVLILPVLMIILAIKWDIVTAGESQEGKILLRVNNITFAGNKITKERIIRRELMFAEGDTLTREELSVLLKQSRENLLNTSLFNFVIAEVIPSSDDDALVDILFHFTERWYIWPWPIIEFADRNFNTWWQDNRDLSRMSYGLVLRWENFRGRKEILEFTARFGYIEQYGFDYTIPYLNKKETLGLGIGASFGRTKEVPVINSDDKLVYYKDDKGYVAKNVRAYTSLIYRKKIYNTHTLRLGYELDDFQDTLIEINPSFSVDNKTQLQFLSLSYQYKSDHRDYKPYPLKGHYFDLELSKKGFGLLDNGGLDVFYLLTTFRSYFQFSKRFYLATGLNSKFSNDQEQPYFMQEAIGYGRDIVRGYEYYVVNGQNFGIFKSNFKFALLPTKEYDIGFIKSDKFRKVHFAFYLNAFFDLGFVDNMYTDPTLNNQLENKLMMGYGLGLDFVTYYDLVFRFEYSINKMNEQGFYLHFTAPI